MKWDNDKASEKKEMVCSHCMRVFLADDLTWSAAEHRPCPYCKRTDALTPILDVRIGAKRMASYSIAFHPGGSHAK
jgi:uncharacterized Zn-finger protein